MRHDCSYKKDLTWSHLEFHPLDLRERMFYTPCFLYSPRTSSLTVSTRYFTKLLTKFKNNWNYLRPAHKGLMKRVPLKDPRTKV